MPYDIWGDWYEEGQAAGSVRDRSGGLASAEDVASSYEQSEDYIQNKPAAQGNVDNELTKRYLEDPEAALSYAIQNRIPETNWPPLMREDPAIKRGELGQDNWDFRYVEPELDELYRENPRAAFDYVRANEVPKKDWPETMQNDQRIAVDESKSGYGQFSWDASKPAPGEPAAVTTGTSNVGGSSPKQYDIAEDQSLYINPNELAYASYMNDLNLPYQEERGQMVKDLYDTYNDGGLTAIDRARMDAIRDQAGDWARGQREATLANFAQRGMSGSGENLLANLMAGQDAAEMVQQQDLQTEAMAQQRAMDALLNANQYGGQLSRDVGSIDQYNQQRDIDTQMMNNQLFNNALLTNTALRGSLRQDQMDKLFQWQRDMMNNKLGAANNFMNWDIGMAGDAAQQFGAENQFRYNAGVAASGKGEQVNPTLWKSEGESRSETKEDNAAVGKTVSDMGVALAKK